MSENRLNENVTNESGKREPLADIKCSIRGGKVESVKKVSDPGVPDALRDISVRSVLPPVSGSNRNLNVTPKSLKFVVKKDKTDDANVDPMRPKGKGSKSDARFDARRRPYSNF